MAGKGIGVALAGRNAAELLEGIRRAEGLGVPAVWLTTGGAGLDALTLLAAAAPLTRGLLLGTSITPTWPRHPVVTAQQAQVVAHLAPGRFRLGVGPSHRPTMEGVFGLEFRRPLEHLAEYVRILKELLGRGSVDFDGERLRAHARAPAPVEVPVMVSALRRRSFELAGAIADGAISWVCPRGYLRDTALPALEEGARRAGRPAPPLVAHVPVCVHEDAAQVRAAAREQLGNYPRVPFYARMFAEAGFPEASGGAWSDGMLEAVVVHGGEAEVAAGLEEVLAWGAREIVVSPVTVGADRQASLERTMRLLARVASG